MKTLSCALALACFAVFWSGVAHAESLDVKDMSVASVYGATTKPSRDQALITTRYNHYKSEYEITAFIRVFLPDLKQAQLSDATLHLKTANRVCENENHEMVLGFTDDAFDTETLTVETYDAFDPWALGHNAGVNPGSAQPPFPNILASIIDVTETDAWYEFQSAALTEYIQQQLDKGEDAFFYITQGKVGTPSRFVSFHGPGEVNVLDSVPYLTLTYKTRPE